jgi:RNA polymerase sigma-70 factor, ECF subfamily
MTSRSAEDPVTAAWRAHHPYLVDVAFRMLGDLGRAEDVVQEAFSRLLQARIDQIDDQRGWLVVVTSRLCLDEIKSARARRERPEQATEIDRHAPAAMVDPADRVTLDDNLRLALVVVLERLNAAERVAFVLHDVFQLPFDTIATTVGTTSAHSRQLARRARQKIQDAEPAGLADRHTGEHRRITETFIAACSNGQLDDLLRVLAPDVSGSIDTRTGVKVRGSDRVARNLLRFWGQPENTLVSYSLGAQTVLLGFTDQELSGILLLSIDADVITEIHVLAEPSKLDFVRSQLALMSTAT